MFVSQSNSKNLGILALIIHRALGKSVTINGSAWEIFTGWSTQGLCNGLPVGVVGLFVGLGFGEGVP